MPPHATSVRRGSLPCTLIDTYNLRYEAEGRDTGRTCTDIDVCMNCEPGKGCFPQPTYNKYYADEYSTINGTAAMMNEIYQRGPISCTVAVTEEFEAYTGGVFEDKTGKTTLDHGIVVAGWGVDDNGVEYWVGRNSWCAVRIPSTHRAFEYT